MGIAAPDAPDAAAAGASAKLPELDAFLDKEFQSKGFVVSSLDSLVGWAQSGSLWPMTLAGPAAVEGGCHPARRTSRRVGRVVPPPRQWRGD